MYHYVRELERSRFPNIKARKLNDFRTQLEYINRNYIVVTVEQIIEAIKGGTPLPENSAWLTFDDGYIEHYLNVLPLLLERGWQGSFFPAANVVLKGTMLDVNKIHFILASTPDPKIIVNEIREFVILHQKKGVLFSFEYYWDLYAKPIGYDPAEVIFIKRVLQQALPENLRCRLIDDLFGRLVTLDENAFAAELYMSLDQLKTMQNLGMYIGSHGAKHCWLDHMNSEEQAEDIDLSLDFLSQIGAPVTDWVMCYPYGVYNDTLIEIIESRGCVCAITTLSAIADLQKNNPFELPRLDTNAIPLC